MSEKGLSEESFLNSELLHMRSKSSPLDIQKSEFRYLPIMLEEWEMIAIREGREWYR